MAEPDAGGLLASFYTLAGPLDPFAGPQVSAIPLRARMDAAARAGFTGFGFGADDLRHAMAAEGAAAIGRMLSDHGLGWCEVELLRGWIDPSGDDAVRRALFDLAARVGARHVKCGTAGPAATDDALAERFAHLCGEAAAAGTSVVIEVSPLGQFAALDRAARVIALAGCANGGLLLDMWHVARGGIDLAAIARLPLGVVRFAELCDGPAVAGADYVRDTVDRRLPCGEGSFPIAAFLAALAASGYHGPFGIEVLSEVQRGLLADAAARRALAGAPLALFQAAELKGEKT